MKGEIISKFGNLVQNKVKCFVDGYPSELHHPIFTKQRQYIQRS
jgi:hypothetical protein